MRLATWNVNSVRSRLDRVEAFLQRHEVDVLAPVPGKPGIRPIRAYITLSTCHPEFSAAQRLIVYGVLKETQLRRE